MKFSPSINIELDRNKTLNYIVTANAHQAVGKIVNGFVTGTHSFCLVGSYGTGKSSFLLAFENCLKNTGQHDLFKYKGQFNSFSDFEFLNVVGDYAPFVDVARVADRAISQPDLVVENTVMVHIDVDPAEIGKNVGPTIPLVGDIKHIFAELLSETITCDFSDWCATLLEYKNAEKPRKAPRAEYVDPAKFITELSNQLDEDAVYVADVGQNQIWSCSYHIVKDGKFLTSGGMGTMGYSSRLGMTLMQ